MSDIFEWLFRRGVNKMKGVETDCCYYFFAAVKQKIQGNKAQVELFIRAPIKVFQSEVILPLH